jgi:hypothetical protein
MEKRMRTIAAREGPRPYNYRHFRPRHVIADALATYRLEGVPPGALAPDFELPDTDDRRWRLSDYRGRPVLLHFGSYT